MKNKLIAILICALLCLLSLSFRSVDVARGDDPLNPPDNPEYNTTPAYFFQGTNIPGSFIRKIPNFDYFWNLFIKHSMWQLEGWNPNTQQWISKWDGQNLNEWLTIDRTRSNDSMDEKISLTVTNHAPIATKFRFTFGIDLRVKEFANRTGQYEYTLTYQANQTQNYNMRFNWSDLIPLVQAGTISLNHGIKNVGGKDLFWFRITGNQNLGAGASFTIDPTYGLIADAETNSWEYDGDEGRYPDMIRLGTSEYYAIVSTGDSGTELDGYIRTIKVWDSNGTIQTSLVDSLEYDTQDGIAPSICLVSGDVYAISYYSDTANKQTIVTVNIDDADGQIGAAVIDTQALTYDSIAASHSQILNMGNNIFAVVYTQVTSTDLYLETWTIATDGTITNTVVDSVEIDATDGIYPDMCMVDSDTVAVVYDAGTGGGNDGYMSTWNISSAGDITNTRADFWEFDTGKGSMPTIAKVSGTTYMYAYEDTNTDLYVKTCTIANTGDITAATLDTQVIDATNGDYPTFFNVSINSIANKWVKGITFSGEGRDGYVSTFDVDSTGQIGSEIDTLETYPANTITWYQPVCFVSGFYFVMATEDDSNDGWLKTFQIYANNPPTISNPSPANGAVDVATIPQLSVDVGDYGDMLNVTWSSNSSGTWQQFGVNRSNANSQVMGYGAINTSVTNSYEYNKQNGQQPDVIKLGSDATFSYFAIVNNGISNDGFINTTKVWNSNGTIYPGNVDSYEYDSSDGYYPSIVHVSGNVYAIAYYDAGSLKETVVTISITSSGDIDTVTGIIDTLQLTYNSLTGQIAIANIIKVIDNIFSIFYENLTGYFIIDTIWINTSGTINNTVLDTQSICSTVITGTEFGGKQVMVDSDTIALIHRSGGGSAAAATITTYNITSAGIITNIQADQWVIETIGGTVCDIERINGNIFAIVYGITIGKLKTVTIADTGAITKTAIDTLNFDTTATYPSILYLGNNIYAITYQGISADGFVITVYITNIGDIACFPYDSLEFDTADSIRYAPILPVANDYYLIVYEGTGNDGWSCTVKIGNDTTTTLRQTNANFSAASTKYYWRVNVSDGNNQNYSIYSFTTVAGGNLFDIDIYPSSWNGGSVPLGTNIRNNFTFWQNGTATIDITIGINNTNYTFVAYATWITSGHDRYCANFTTNTWATESSITPGYPPSSVLKNDFAPGNFNFGVRIWMPRTVTYSNKQEDFKIVLVISEST